MAVERIEVGDNSVLVEVEKLADRLKVIEANQGGFEVIKTNLEKLQADITQIKEDVKPTAEPI